MAGDFIPVMVATMRIESRGLSCLCGTAEYSSRVVMNPDGDIQYHNSVTMAAKSLVVSRFDNPRVGKGRGKGFMSD